MAVAETVVAAWVLIAGGSTPNYPKFYPVEFSTKERCEYAAKEIKRQFSDSHVAICVPK